MSTINSLDSIDYEAIARRFGTDRNNEIENQIRQSGYISLSKAHLFYNKGGAQVLHMLNSGGARGMSWKLEVTHHFDGRPVKPGDTFRWKRSQHNRDKYGEKYNALQILELHRRGEHGKLVDYAEEKLGKDLTIEVGFHDASSLLSQWGYCKFGEQTYPITKRKEFAGGKDGKVKRPNWIVREVISDTESQ